VANELQSSKVGHLVGITADNNFFLNITSSGSWTVHITQPRPASAPGTPQTFTGTTSAYSGFIQLNAGVANFNMTYQGDGNFIIWLCDSNGHEVDLVENVIGPSSDSKGSQVSAGIYILDIQASGSWSVTVSQ
jgi:hypothetical protein